MHYINRHYNLNIIILEVFVQNKLYLLKDKYEHI